EVEMSDFDEAIDRVVAGLRKKNRLINPREREIVAVHETGHALVALFTEGADKVHKISIIPRGIAALGMTQQLPTDDRYLVTRKELEARIDVLFGGRAAEQVVFNEISTGAHNDLDRATDIVRAMILEYGMSDTLGERPRPRRRGPAFLGDRAGLMAEPREYSEATAQALDTEAKRMLDERLARVVQLLTEKRPLLDRVSKALLEKETLEASELEELVRSGAGAGRNGACRRATGRATIGGRVRLSRGRRGGSARRGAGGALAGGCYGVCGTCARGRSACRPWWRARVQRPAGCGAFLRPPPAAWRSRRCRATAG